MNSSFVISDAVVRALGWALVHTLWQGAALALVLLVLLPRLAKARHRYVAAYSALMAVFATAAITFFWVFEPPVANVTLANGVPTFGPFIATQQQVLQQSWLENMTDWLESHYVAIVLVWLLGFIFFMLRLSTGLWQVHQLQTRHLKPVEAAWQSKIGVLSARLGLKKNVRLFESALARSPMAIGWLKPVVLFPISLVNRLSPAEVEAVLAHELAHIARRDWLFNLLQAFVEALFYYHPAVWWVSAVIRRERENCCDDDALAATGSPLIFAKALVQVQELATPAPRLALGIGGSSRRPLLLERIRRILNQPQQKSQVMEKLTATAILLVLLTFIGLHANTPPTVAAAFSQISDWPGAFWNSDASNDTGDLIAQDSVPKGKSIQKITREDDHGKVEMELNNGQITRLNLDGKEIPATEFGEYGQLARELQRAVPPPPVPPVPSVPPVPPFPPMPPTPPTPPMPFYVYGAPKMSTETDSEGNVIIKLEKDGKPMEIKVKNGEVWMDGKKLEKGETIDLPGMGFSGEPFNWNINGNQFHMEGLGENFDPAISFSFSNEDRARWEEQVEAIRERSDNYRQEYQALRERYRDQEMSADEKKKMEKELKAFEEDWKNNQDKWQSELDHWKLEQEHWQAEQEKWQTEHHRSNGFQQALTAELIRDNLISDPGDYSFKLSAKSVQVNGKKLSDEQHAKYIDLYKRVTGKSMEKGDSYTIELHN